MNVNITIFNKYKRSIVVLFCVLVTVSAVAANHTGTEFVGQH